MAVGGMDRGTEGQMEGWTEEWIEGQTKGQMSGNSPPCSLGPLLNRSPKGNMWSAIPVALLCMVVN